MKNSYSKSVTSFCRMRFSQKIERKTRPENGFKNDEIDFKKTLSSRFVDILTSTALNLWTRAKPTRQHGLPSNHSMRLIACLHIYSF